MNPWREDPLGYWIIPAWLTFVAGLVLGIVIDRVIRR